MKIDFGLALRTCICLASSQLTLSLATSFFRLVMCCSNGKVEKKSGVAIFTTVNGFDPLLASATMSYHSSGIKICGWYFSRFSMSLKSASLGRKLCPLTRNFCVITVNGKSVEQTSFRKDNAIFILRFCPPQLSNQATSSVLSQDGQLLRYFLMHEAISCAPRDATPSCHMCIIPVSSSQLWMPRLYTISWRL